MITLVMSINLGAYLLIASVELFRISVDVAKLVVTGHVVSVGN